MSNRPTPQSTILSEEEFDQRFTTVLDTDGETIRPQIPAVGTYDPKCLWTALDCDGDIHLVPGRAFVNRMGYVITEEQWTPDIESAAYFVHDEDEAPEDQE